MKKFEIHYPIDTLWKTQDFGVTSFLDYYKNNGVILTGHNGIDYSLAYGYPIRAAHDGIAYYEVDNSQGHGVVVRTEQEYDYNGKPAFMKSIYWHMIDGAKDPKYKSPIMGKSGVRVRTGDIIGYANSTGLSTGNHLHFGIKPCALGEPHNTWYNLEQNNGMYGAIDPNPYWSGKYASKVFAPFITDMKYEDETAEAERLQRFLAVHGYFYGAYFPRYGELTRQAVYRFQLDHVPMSFYERFILRGRLFGPKTRSAVNRMLGA